MQMFLIALAGISPRRRNPEEVLYYLARILRKVLTVEMYSHTVNHGGARPPPVCAHRAWVDFFKMALKKCAKAYGFRHIGF